MKAAKEHRIIQKRTFDNLSNSKRGVMCIQREGFVIINVNIAGSGHQYINDSPRIIRPKHEKLEHGGAYGTVTNRRNEIYDISIAGPQAAGGIFDIGDNRISKIVKTVVKQIEGIISQNNHKDSFQICFVGHSRGAVAVALIIEKIESLKGMEGNQLWRKVNILSSMQYDPVPGQTLGVSAKERFIHSSDVSPYYKTNLKRKVQNSIVVYSVYTQYGKEKKGTFKSSFIPQAVYGTDIIILELANHSVMINKGMQFSDYQLAPGVYIKHQRTIVKLENFQEYDAVRKTIILNYQRTEASKSAKPDEVKDNYKYQIQRYNVIHNIVCQWFYDHGKY